MLNLLVLLLSVALVVVSIIALVLALILRSLRVNVYTELRRAWQRRPSCLPCIQSASMSVSRAFSRRPSASACNSMLTWEIDARKIKYKRRLGKGSFGEVWLGCWLGSTVAVKSMLPSLQHQEKLVKRFIAEIHMQSKLHHPNVTMLMATCTKKPHLCLVLEYCAHGSLHAFLRNEHVHGIQVTMPLMYRFAVDIARGVHYLHRKLNVAQRDLKAHNILIDQNLNAKVADFGLSRFMEQEQGNKLTVCGTPAFTAPEIVRQERYSLKVDVYSFGVVMWELYTKKDPYGGRKGVQIAYAVAQRGLRPRIPPDCPTEYAQLMQQCWADDPDERPGFREILERLFQMKKDAASAAASAIVRVAAHGSSTQGTAQLAEPDLHALPTHTSIAGKSGLGTATAPTAAAQPGRPADGDISDEGDGNWPGQLAAHGTGPTAKQEPAAQPVVAWSPAPKTRARRDSSGAQSSEHFRSRSSDQALAVLEGDYAPAAPPGSIVVVPASSDASALLPGAPASCPESARHP